LQSKADSLIKKLHSPAFTTTKVSSGTPVSSISKRRLSTFVVALTISKSSSVCGLWFRTTKKCGFRPLKVSWSKRNAVPGFNIFLRICGGISKKSAYNQFFATSACSKNISLVTLRTLGSILNLSSEGFEGFSKKSK